MTGEIELDHLQSFLDPHLWNQILRFYAQKEKLSDKEREKVLTLQCAALEKTGLYSELIAAQSKLGKSISAELQERADGVSKMLQASEERNQTILAIANNEQIRSHLRHDLIYNAKYLAQNHQYSPEMLPGFEMHAKLLYEMGNYASAAELMSFFRYLIHTSEIKISIFWGQFAADLLAGNWEFAFEHFKRISSLVETRNWPSPAHQLQQRLWLCHWGLFLFFKYPNGHELLLDYFLQPSFLTAIHMGAPHLLRYIYASLILSRRRRSTIRNLMLVTSRESESPSDSFAELIKDIYDRFDFTRIPLLIKECLQLAENDYFLAGHVADIRKHCRLVLLDVLTQLHGKISAEAVSSILAISYEELTADCANLQASAFKYDETTKTFIRDVVPSAQHIRAKLTQQESRTISLAERVGL